MKYLNEELIRQSFLRLRQKEKGGKKGSERTSALILFLAFDALLKRTSVGTPVDLDPENSIGKNNRDLLTREFERLLLVKNVNGVPYHVSNLGVLTIGGSAPDKRFSANFLTVPLKAATTDNKVYCYPNRPNKPIIVLGLHATNLTWGIDRHVDWQQNLPVFLEERITKTPFHDLACFVLRQRGFESQNDVSFQEALLEGLSEIFTGELCSYWKTKLAFEKPYFPKMEDFFQDSMPTPFEDHTWAAENDNLATRISVLHGRINYLENLLKIHHIGFEAETTI